MIHDVIERRMADGQLDECDLSLKEIKSITASFKSTLLSMMHSRVAYPKHPSISETKSESRGDTRPGNGSRTTSITAA